MSDITVASPEPTSPPVTESEAEPTDRSFVRIAIILGIITAIEIAWSYLPFWEDAEGAVMIAEIGGLIFMMLLKFVMVVAWFMHVKFDKPVVARIFYGAFIFALFVFIAALAAFEVWTTKTPGYVP